MINIDVSKTDSAFVSSIVNACVGEKVVLIDSLRRQLAISQADVARITKRLQDLVGELEPVLDDVKASYKDPAAAEVAAALDAILAASKS